MDNYEKIVKSALKLMVERCPRLSTFCYWAGTSAISLEELGHRKSYDLDFHTRRALHDVRPILAEIQNRFSDQFEIVQAPDQFGSGFRGTLRLQSGERITIEVLSNFEDVSDDDLMDSTTIPLIKRITLSKYLGDKIQCVAERMEAKDLVDIRSVLKKFPEMKDKVIHFLSQQDALLIAERLFSWTNKSIEDDLAAYPDADPKDAVEARDLLLKWLKHNENQRGKNEKIR